MNTKRNLIQICLLCAALSPALTSGAQTVTKIAAGDMHSLFLKSDGSLWSMGSDQYGQLGDGNATTYKTNLPEMIVASGVTTIAVGGFQSLFIKGDGSLWAMGNNDFGGELGDGTFNNTNHPEQIVPGIPPLVTAIAGAYDYSLFLKSDGSLWGMGDNAEGQLGGGPLTKIPKEIVTNNVTTIAAGYSTYFEESLFLMNDGSLWAMGDNSYGELGNGTYTTIYTANLPQKIVPANVTAIAGGGEYSLFLMGDGSLWGMGRNDYGQLGDGTSNSSTNLPEMIVTNGVTAIAAGSYHSLFIKNDGSLWAMGDNQYGELGDGTYNNTNRPEMIVASGVTAIAAGAYHSLFIKNDGSLWAMGYNINGQLGDGTYGNAPYYATNRPEQIVAGVPLGYNQISAQVLSGNNVQLSFVGAAGTNYALDRTFKLSPANWVPVVTNVAGAGGVVVFTNAPIATTNNFWRIRSVP
jgi:alpha-tubulin suppressor-like RCC1 family protein